MLNKMKSWASQLKRDIKVLWFLARNPELKWYYKGLILIILGVAFSPIDLIPDFIPILGYIDDLIFIPIGITLVLKLVPDQLLQQARKEADQTHDWQKPVHYWGAIVIVSIWLILAIGIGRKFVLNIL